MPESARVVRLEPTNDGALWDRMVAGSPGATAFHDWSWLDLQARITDVHIERLLILDGDAPVGVFPVTRRWRHSPAALTPRFPFLGPLVPAPLLVPALRAFRRWQRSSGLVIGRFQFGAPLASGAKEALAEAGDTWRSDSTVVLDLSHGSIDTMRANYSAMRRKSIRRAVRSGSTVRASLPGELAALLPRVLDDAYSPRGFRSPYPEKAGAIIESWTANRPDVYVATAFVNDEPAGVLVLLGGHPNAMLWAGGGLRRFRAADPNVLLHDHVFAWAIEHGYAGIDFAGVVDEGVLRFKLAFGGTQQEYLAAESFLGPAWSRAVPRRLRRLVRR